MKNKKSKITELEEVLKKNEHTNSSNPSYRHLKEANDLYNKLLHDGVIKKRGYTLRGLEDSHLYFTSISS